MVERIDNHNSIRSLIRQFWIVIIIFFILIGTFIYFNYASCIKEKKEYRQFILSLTDTLSNTKDSVDVLNIALLHNRKIEDSLQARIDHTLDTLEILERKLRVMQNNSSITKDVIVGVLDSIDIYRQETEQLKKEIARINKENAMLLQKERINNNLLRRKIRNYEKRLMALYAINLHIKSYKDGHDQNSRLVTSKRAKKVEELQFSFKLTRDLTNNDIISVALMKKDDTIMELADLQINGRIVRRSFKLKEFDLRPGRYDIIVFHDNEAHDINRMEIGRGSIELE